MRTPKCSLFPLIFDFWSLISTSSFEILEARAVASPADFIAATKLSIATRAGGCGGVDEWTRLRFRANNYRSSRLAFATSRTFHSDDGIDQ